MFLKKKKDERREYAREKYRNISEEQKDKKLFSFRKFVFFSQA